MEGTYSHDIFLIERCQSGDLWAFDALMNRYESRAYQYALRLTKHTEEARDVVSEAFVRVFRAIKQFRSSSAFSTWLYRILRNCFLDMRKRKALKIVGSLDAVRELEEGEVQIQAIDPHMSPEETLLRSDHSRQVLSALGRLTSIQRRMILLYHLEQFTYDEISSMLDLPVGTVKSRLNRARIALKDVLRHQPELLAV